MSARIQVLPVSCCPRDAVLALRVHPHQLDYVGRITDLLADAEACGGSEPMAVVHDGAVIGYYRIEYRAATVLGHAPPRPTLGLRAFFLDAACQGHGLGQAAIRAACTDLAQRHAGHEYLVLTVNVRNRSAVRCYLRAGFQDTGTLYHGGRAGPQHLLRYPLAQLHP